MKDYTLDEMIDFLTKKLNEQIAQMRTDNLRKDVQEYLDFRHEEMSIIEQIRNELYKMKMEK